jgi:hypothetical protein
MPPPGFTIIDNEAIDRGAEVGTSAFAVYAAIARHVDEQRRAWPGIDRLAKMTGISPRWVMHAIRHLETAGWLVVDRTPGRRNTYILPPIKSGEPQFTTPDRTGELDFTPPVNPSSPGGESQFTPPVNPSSPEGYPVTKPKNKTHLTTPKRGKAAAGLVEIPVALNGGDFPGAWDRWLTYRRGRRLTCTPATLTGQLNKLAPLGPAGAAAEIENSITNGWQSVCYPGTNGNGKPRTSNTGIGQRHPGDRHTAPGQL